MFRKAQVSQLSGCDLGLLAIIMPECQGEIVMYEDEGYTA